MSLDFTEAIERKVMLFDGGMGTMLIAKGLTDREVPEGWNIERPEEVKAVHSAYIEAGAEVIQTNTFGANRIKLAASEEGRSLDPSEVNERAAAIARETIDESSRSGIFLAGDVGPTGLFFPPVGNLTPGEARNAFKEQASALERGGVDLFLVETMYDVREALEALRGIREASGKPVVVELTFERKPRGFFTLFGDTPSEGASKLASEGADMVGSNCTIASADMIELARIMRTEIDAPLIFQPNAGKPEMEHGKAVYRQRPEEFAADMMEIVRIGANAVGGCCGTSPEFIRMLHEHLVHGH
ncbi:methionine synthase I, cobalamin-binding domain-containing protein [bacterium]|nr:MAG: methionine synthase I, cobalamin-binding domain-containing protein [bacterium]